MAGRCPQKIGKYFHAFSLLFSPYKVKLIMRKTSLCFYDIFISEALFLSKMK